MDRVLRVDSPGVDAMANRWRAATGDLGELVAPTGLGLPCQTSAAAVECAQGEVAEFTASLAALVERRATHVMKADANYVALESTSAAALAAVSE